MKQLNYERTRWVLLLVGLIFLGGLATVMFARRVDPVEVAATILFLPVFMAFILFGLRGGLIAGLLAAGAYVALRMPAIEAVGAGRFVGLIFTRTVGYLAFGTVGGWAASILKDSITKLDLYDHIDSETGLHNSRYLIQTIDLEKSRATRYEKIFSVVTIEQGLDAHGKDRVKLIKEVAAGILAGARNVDQVVHATDDGIDVFSVVLPETGVEGSRIFADKLTQHLNESVGVQPGGWASNAVTFPDNEPELAALVERFHAIVKADFPESAAG